MFDNQLCKSLKIRHRIFNLSLGGHFSLIIDRKALQVAIPRAARLNETLKMRRKEVLAPKIGNDAPFGTAGLPVVLHQTDVFEYTRKRLWLLTVRGYMICHDQNAEQIGGQSSLNLYPKAK